MLDPRTTERRNPRTAAIDLATPLEIVDLINAEDRRSRTRSRRSAREIAEAIEPPSRPSVPAAASSTSAPAPPAGSACSTRARCPPTFGTDPEMVQGIIAGGIPALTSAQEGAEDIVEQARSDLDARGVRDRRLRHRHRRVGHDAVRARSALEHAKSSARARRSSPARRRRRTCSTTSTSRSSPITGPEVVTGSTRMKAGTATKLVLNMITTGAMIRLGKTFGNLMVDLRATNDKLDDRSERIVVEVCGVSRDEARELLDAAGGSVKIAIVMQKLGVDRDAARERLENAGGVIRRDS